ncbi:glutamate-5-semialdehyde dehydrogenase [Aliikangiella sp. G2MR2-5]|uniref:glutamate-5-semialdehyde dehydrogenase n=1 Tax=Aliikangiella sp. G2MR2-5 TaxID=2788943 RepID=UPI001AEE55CF|nr:glutamate-5-semialdehyde dehydrogenase [Aliikangiella sp. G2MR2-5]
MMNAQNYLVKIKQVKQQSKEFGCISTEQKNQTLLSMAVLIKEKQKEILAANQLDLESAIKSGLSDAMVDRLRLNDERICQMIESLTQVASLDDPLTVERNAIVRPIGIEVKKKSIPLGVILMIYESRPNVTVEAAALALKSGNAIILRGGKEAFETNQLLGTIWKQALLENDLNETNVFVLDTTDREILDELLKMDEFIDVVIPRGGEGLIRHVVANSYIPVIKHYKGVCHLYINQSADFEKALNILVNGKTQRPGVCNALEGLLVDRSIAADFLPAAVKALREKNVVIKGCEESCAIDSYIELAKDDDFGAEFLSLIISCKVVSDLEEAIKVIDRYGSGHTEVVVTEDSNVAERFINRVDASVVMVNASSRFSDGGELGLGAEIGISTSKLHAYGPMGLDALTSEKFVVVGDGQVRG